MFGFENTIHPSNPSTIPYITLAKVNAGKCSQGFGFQSGPTNLYIIPAKITAIMAVIYFY